MAGADEAIAVEGVAEASAAYAAIAADARDMGEPHRLIATAGAEAARARAPVRTGRLVGSIDGQATERDATLIVGVPYWPFTEFGTRYVLATHYAQAGIEAMAKAAPDAYAARMAAIIDRRTK